MEGAREESGERERRKKEGKRKEELRPKSRGVPFRKEEDLCWAWWPLRDQVSKTHGLPDLQTTLHAVDVGNHARAMGQSAFPGHYSPCLARSGRGLCGGPV